ncbi:hypothetical protein ACHAO7_008458 [Fusarium culmorum]
MIRDISPGFRIRVEHLAAILLVQGEDLRDKGHLSPDKCSPYKLKDRLCEISPFCKHCKIIRATIKIELTDQIIDMLQLDATNEERLDRKEWAHALPQLPKPEPRPEPGMSLEDTAMSIHYLCRFRTGQSTQSLSPNLYKKVEEERKVRDNHKCVVTGRPNPRVFWFIPRKFNDTKDHNDAAGNIRAGCMYLTKIDLLDKIHSATELGKTQRVWNMLCVDPVIYDALTLGLCAFKYVSKLRLDGGVAKVLLQFFWMPELPGRFNQVMDLNDIRTFDPQNENGFTTFNYDKAINQQKREISVDLSLFQRGGCPIPTRVERTRAAISTPPLLSGQHVYITMPEQEVKQFEQVVTIHWACVTFVALCGGAGRAWFLTGVRHEDGSSQPRDEAFREDEKKKRQSAQMDSPKR